MIFVVVSNNSELRFKEWLENKGYAYLYIDQSIDCFSSLFKGITKRPDFLVVINSIGIIAVDVKERKISDKYESFVIDEEEIQKLLSFERVFRIPLWLAFSVEAVQFRTWYWVSLSEVVEKVSLNTRTKDDKPFRPIPMKMCKTIGWESGLSSLFGL